MAIDKAKADALKAQHGQDLHELEAMGLAVVVRRPTKADWTRFKAESVDPKLRLSAYENLLISATVFPERAELVKMIEERPALAEVFGDEVAGLAGAGEAVRKNAL